MIPLCILKDSSEIIRYYKPSIPILIEHMHFSEPDRSSVLCHWHDDMEYAKSTRGEMTYSVNGQTCTVHENDAILVNSRQMHYNYLSGLPSCSFICMVFKTQLFCTNPELTRQYISSITEHPHLPYYYLHASNPAEAAIIEQFDAAYALYDQRDVGWELEIVSCLNRAWAQWYRLLPPLSGGANASDPNIAIQKQMIQFLYENYASKLSLQDIAQSGGVCRSTCCQIFKKYLGRTPIQFLTAYRLEKAMDLLHNPIYSVTDIALSCGFSNTSYFSETFLKWKGCTPSNYRACHLERTAK